MTPAQRQIDEYGGDDDGQGTAEKGDTQRQAAGAPQPHAQRQAAQECRAAHDAGIDPQRQEPAKLKEDGLERQGNEDGGEGTPAQDDPHHAEQGKVYRAGP